MMICIYRTCSYQSESPSTMQRHQLDHESWKINLDGTIREPQTLTPTSEHVKFSTSDSSSRPGASWQATEASYDEAANRSEASKDWVPDNKTFDQFINEVKDLLDSNATKKGYNTTGVDGKNQLYEFIHGISGDGHALGEIIYKAIRFNRKRDVVDLLKIAAWSYLIWKHGKK